MPHSLNERWRESTRRSVENCLNWATPRPKDGEVWKDDRLDKLMELIDELLLNQRKELRNAIQGAVIDNVDLDGAEMIRVIFRAFDQLD